MKKTGKKKEKKGFSFSDFSAIEEKKQEPLNVAFVFHAPEEIDEEGNILKRGDIANPLNQMGIKSNEQIPGHSDLKVTEIYYGKHNGDYYQYQSPTPSYSESILSPECKERTEKTIDVSKKNDLVVHVVYTTSNSWLNEDNSFIKQCDSVRSAVEKSASNKARHVLLRCNKETAIFREEQSPRIKTINHFLKAIPISEISAEKSIMQEEEAKNLTLNQLSSFLLRTGQQTPAIQEQTSKIMDDLVSKTATEICTNIIKAAYKDKYPQKEYPEDQYQKYTTEGKLFEKIKAYCKDTFNHGTTYCNIKQAVSEKVLSVEAQESKALKEEGQFYHPTRYNIILTPQEVASLDTKDIFKSCHVKKEFIKEVGNQCKSCISFGPFGGLKFSNIKQLIILDKNLHDNPTIDSSSVNAPQATFLMATKRIETEGKFRLGKGVLAKIGDEAFGTENWSNKVRATQEKQEKELRNK